MCQSKHGPKSESEHATNPSSMIQNISYQKTVSWPVRPCHDVLLYGRPSPSSRDMPRGSLWVCVSVVAARAPWWTIIGRSVRPECVWPVLVPVCIFHMHVDHHWYFQARTYGRSAKYMIVYFDTFVLTSAVMCIFFPSKVQILIYLS